MIKWKDFLYFSKEDRIAIILLSILICISGGIFIYLNIFSGVNPSYISRTEEAERKFIEFENNMTDIEYEAGDSVATGKSNVSKQLINNKLKAGQRIDINSASQNDLMRIPGIGATLSERIIERREELGGFASLEQLQEIKGITVNKFSSILPHLIIKKKQTTISINKATREQLIIHPYLNNPQADFIISVREEKKINSFDELIHNRHFTPRDIKRLEPYLSFD